MELLFAFEKEKKTNKLHFKTIFILLFLHWNIKQNKKEKNLKNDIATMLLVTRL